MHDIGIDTARNSGLTRRRLLHFAFELGGDLVARIAVVAERHCTVQTYMWLDVTVSDFMRRLRVHRES